MTPQVTNENGKAKKVAVQKTFFNLDTFEDVTLKKEFDPLPPVTSVQEAAGRLGNDAERLLEIINNGLVAEQRKDEAKDPTGWSVLGDDGELGGEFAGTVGDSKKINAARLQFAKTSIAPMLGLDWDKADKKQKATIIEETTKFMRETAIIRDGLRKSAALKFEDVDAS